MNVAFTTVVRATGPQEPHGHLWFADLATGEARCALLWDVPVTGHPRGGPRGLRGVCWHRDRLWLAAWDAILELDAGLDLVRIHKHDHLVHVHQLAPWGDQLLAVSTAYDCVLALDTRSGEFTWGLSVRGHPDDPVIEVFDPRSPRDPGDSVHLNTVHVRDGRITVSGTRLRLLVEVVEDRAEARAALPFGTHDAQWTERGVLYSDTERDRVVWGECSWPIPRVDPHRLTHLDGLDGMARQAFARGLLQLDADTAIGGASPGALHRYHRRDGVDTVCRVTHDVRCAVHGLCSWPHALPVGPPRSAATEASG